MNDEQLTGQQSGSAIRALVTAVDTLRTVCDGLREQIEKIACTMQELKVLVAVETERSANHDKDISSMKKVLGFVGNAEVSIPSRLHDLEQSVAKHHKDEEERNRVWLDARWKILVSVVGALALAAIAFIWQAVQYKVVNDLTKQMKDTMTTQIQIERRVGISEDKADAATPNDGGQKP